MDHVYGYLIECVVEPDDGGFYAHCPGLGGVHVGGDTEEEALTNAYHAALAIIEAHFNQGDPIPEGPHLVALRKPLILPDPDMEHLVQRQMRKPRSTGTTHSKELLVPIAS